jgi:CrcB protein
VEAPVTRWLLVGGFGALGAVVRHLLDVALRRRLGPGPSLGVLVANLTGSALFGAVAGHQIGHDVDPQLRLALTTGFCGALTTFSTLMAEVVELLEGEGERHGAWPAIGWALLSVGGGVGVAATAWTLAGG